MAVTGTVTKTKTFPRLELLKMQIFKALRRTTSLTEQNRISIQKGIDKGWIKIVNIYGLDYNDLCRVHLKLEIDWNEHNRQISRGKVSVTIDGKWVDDTAIEVDEPIILFNKIVGRESLLTKWQVSYQPHLNEDEINKILGFVKAYPPKWARGYQGDSAVVEELSELQVGLYLPDDEW